MKKIIDKVKNLFKTNQCFVVCGTPCFNAFCVKCLKRLNQKDLSDRNAKFCNNENCTRVGLETYFWIEQDYNVQKEDVG